MREISDPDWVFEKGKFGQQEYAVLSSSRRKHVQQPVLYLLVFRFRTVRRWRFDFLCWRYHNDADGTVDCAADSLCVSLRDRQ
jgi:hypothetical protein